MNAAAAAGAIPMASIPMYRSLLAAAIKQAMATSAKTAPAPANVLAWARER
jgi:hypothetical protein